jgi:hypothetical protein
MRYLRMLTNALVGGLMGAAFVTILVLQLNRHLPLDLWTLLPLYGRLAAFYAPHLTVAFYGLLVARELIGRRPASAHWVSVRVLSWEGTIVVTAAAALMWLNYAGFRVVLDADSGRRLAAAAGATTLCALLLTVVTVVHYSFGRRGSRVGATLLVLTLAASLLFPLVARGWGERRPLAARALDLLSSDLAESEGPRVTVVAVDGASLDYIAQAVGEGRLPNLGRMLEGGASMHLATIRPTQPVPVWTTVASGKYPARTGVRAAASYSYAADHEPIELLPDLCFSHALVHLGILRESPYRSTSVRARPIWAILGSQRLTSGIVSWPVTSPAGPVRGFLITDRFAQSVASNQRVDDVELGSPEAAVLRARAIVRGPLGVPAGTLERPPWAPDAFTREVALQLRDEYRPRLLMLRHEGIDRVGHLYLRYARPREFGGVPDAAARRQLGGVVDRYYAFLDAEIAELLATLGPEDVLLVVSGFGMEPVSLVKRALARAMRQPEVSGTHEGAPDGFLLAYGASVRAGRVRLGQLVDVTPTILYFLGLPVARDMDGEARTDIFTRAFSGSRLITYIPSYER